MEDTKLQQNADNSSQKLIVEEVAVDVDENHLSSLSLLTHPRLFLLCIFWFGVNVITGALSAVLIPSQIPRLQGIYNPSEALGIVFGTFLIHDSQSLTSTLDKCDCLGFLQAWARYLQ
jgi:hypothetical protein